MTAPLAGPVLRLVGIDPGSRRIGLAALSWDRDTQRGEIVDAHQVDAQEPRRAEIGGSTR